MSFHTCHYGIFAPLFPTKKNLVSETRKDIDTGGAVATAEVTAVVAVATVSLAIPLYPSALSLGHGATRWLLPPVSPARLKPHAPL